MFRRSILFIFFLFTFHFYTFTALPQSDIIEDSANIRSKALSYLHEVAKEKTPKVKITETIVIYILDFGLSLFLLWLALFLNGIRGFRPRQYAWFLFAINLYWFICLMAFRWIWNGLTYLILNLSPDLSGVILDHLSLVIIFSGFGLYIWLLARTFNVGFIGALKTFVFSNFVYFIIIFIFFYFYSSTENLLLDSANSILGFKQAMHSYLIDLKKISSGSNIISFLRIRLYHL